MGALQSITKNPTMRLIETFLPFRELNLDATIEMSFKGISHEVREEYQKVFGIKPMVIGPRLRNLHTWFARRPSSPSRALTLLASLPVSAYIDTDRVKGVMGFKNLKITAKKYGAALITYTSPDRAAVCELIKKYQGRSSHEIVFADPMAGGGSIPFESLRLGFRTIAIEYNPVAYLILKATLEFPAKYADSGLFEETLKVAKEFISLASEQLSKYYGEDAENYIFARGIRCPFCNGLIPVQGFAPQITNNSRFKKRYLKIEFDKEKKIFNVETTETHPQNPLEKRGNNIKCPYCDKWFQLRGKAKTGLTAFDTWFQQHAELMRRIVEEFEQVTPEMNEKLLELHIPLVKQTRNTFVAIWNDENERKRFLQAFMDLSKEILELQDFIPIEDIPDENKWASITRNKGLKRWYMLFNPRQLLVVAKLSKLVATTAEKLVSKNGELGAAIALYLAFAIDKLLDHNTIATSWISSRGVVRGTYTGLGLNFRQDYCEINTIIPGRSLEWALETNIAEGNKFTRTRGGILPVVKFLCDEFRGAGLGDYVTIYLANATKLSEMLGTGTVDIINVDPPYFEQVIYSDMSELFWVILRRALKPVLELLFKPGIKLSEWNWTNPTVPRDYEIVTYDKRDSSGKFGKLFGDFINETYKVLKDDGVLILWFTHPTDVAWRIVGQSLYSAGYVVSKIWPIKTEMKSRMKKHVHGIAQETSLIIVARKYERIRLVEVGANFRMNLLYHPKFVEAVKEVVEDARKVSKEAGASPADMMTLMLGSALSVATKFEIPGLIKFEDLFDAAATKVDELFISPLIYRVLVETGLVKLSDADANTVVEYVRSAMLHDATTRSYMTLWFLSRVNLESGVYRNKPLPLNYDFAQTVAKLLGYSIDRLREVGLIGEFIMEESVENEEEEENEKGGGRAFYPLMFEVLSAASAVTTWSKLSALTPARALYLAYLALHESGAQSVRADSIKRKISMWGDGNIAEASSLAIVLLETARDIDLGFKHSQNKGLDIYFNGAPSDSEAKIARELAIRTLIQLLPHV